MFSWSPRHFLDAVTFFIYQMSTARVSNEFDFASGWMRFTGIFSDDDLLSLARLFGTPIASRTGEIIKRLSPQAAADARPRTLSSLYGTNKFPFHTDTAFWHVPAKFVVLRVRGDLRRSTSVITFRECMQRCEDSLSISTALKSVWTVKTNASAFYCSMAIRNDDTIAWRFDTHCMIPANTAAIEVTKQFRTLLASVEGDSIQWNENEAVVVANWAAMHARGSSPEGERERILDRIYVR